MIRRATLLLALTLLLVDTNLAQQPNTIPPGYRVETIKLPEGVTFGVAGLDVAANGDVYAGTRFGDVWRYRNGTWNLFADGLHEIAGIRIDRKAGEILVAQKPELTRLIDEDEDGQADLYETVTDAWGFTGNYHEFAFGPVKDSQGNLYGTLNLSHGIGRQVGGSTMSIGIEGRGTCFRVAPDGSYSTFAWGLRSPAGIGINPKNDELFYTDNQGDWNASSSLHQLFEGEFYGHPCSLIYHPDYKDVDVEGISVEQLNELRRRPVIWIPHGEMANSPGNPVFDTTNGKFGPFTDQIFVGDQTRSNIFRCVLDEVAGRYQGACIEFINHLQCGAVRLKFAPDGSMWVGQTSRGWGSVGSAPYGVERIVYDGQTVPFEIHSVSLTKKGFLFRFTQPLAPDAPLESSMCDFTHWGYLYHSRYGSPKIDEVRVIPDGMEVREEGMALHITLPDLRKERVYRLHLKDLRAASGESLTTPRAYYTLNELR